jgi:hypothetical protein
MTAEELNRAGGVDSRDCTRTIYSNMPQQDLMDGRAKIMVFDKVWRLPYNAPIAFAGMGFDIAKQQHPRFLQVMKAYKLAGPKPKWYQYGS